MAKRKTPPAQLDREIAASLRSRARAAKKPPRSKRLVVEYDVTGLKKGEVDALEGYAVVQGEASDTYDVGHPDVKVTSRRQQRGKRKLLVVSYDLEGLTDDEVDVLTGEALAQAEGNDGGLYIDGKPTTPIYPSVKATSKIV